MVRVWLLVTALSFVWPEFVLAEERIALVIGNSAYSSVTPLDNAENDAVLMAEALTGVGFDVTLVTNAVQNDLKAVVADFGSRLRASGPDTVGLFYYAGHGVQSFGSNYLLPTDAALTDAADLDLVALEAASVLRQMASARNRTNIVILDACRNNPFENIRDLNDNGLAEMKAPTGTFLAYATSPGAVAYDGSGGNSPFTEALARSIMTEGAQIEQVFKAVRVNVLEQTDGAQTPWDTSSLTQNFYFQPARQPTPAEVAERQLWEPVRNSRDPVQIMLFLRSYPDGVFADEARALLSETLEEELQPGDTSGEAPAEVAAPEAPAPAAGGDDREMALMEAARASGLLEDYQAYLEAYPDGLFAQLVKLEIAALEESDTRVAAAPPKTDAAGAAQGGAQSALATDGQAPVFYDQPLSYGVPEIVGLTIAEVLAGSPLFAPIEGLPDEVWRDKTCGNCHQWTRQDLCNQGTTYLGASRALTKEHPYGGSFKKNLQIWAEGGCQ